MRRKNHPYEYESIPTDEFSTNSETFNKNKSPLFSYVYVKWQLWNAKRKIVFVIIGLIALAFVSVLVSNTIFGKQKVLSSKKCMFDEEILPTVKETQNWTKYEHITNEDFPGQSKNFTKPPTVSELNFDTGLPSILQHVHPLKVEEGRGGGDQSECEFNFTYSAPDALTYDFVLAAFEKLNVTWFLINSGTFQTGRSGISTDTDIDIGYLPQNGSEYFQCSDDYFHCSHRQLGEFTFKMRDIFREINKKSFDSQFKIRMKACGQLQITSKHSSLSVDIHPHFISFDGLFLIGSVMAEYKSSSIPLQHVFPLQKCRSGQYDMPCVKDLVYYSHVANNGEYSGYGEHKADNYCLLWDINEKQPNIEQIRLTMIKLSQCGYNTMCGLLHILYQNDNQT